MGKHILKILFLFIFLLPLEVNGYSYCPTETIVTYQKLAGNVTTTYDYEIINGQAVFTVKILNLHEDFYIMNNQTEEIIYSKGTSEVITLNNMSSGSYSFTVYTDLNNCEDRPFSTFYIILPYYNDYYLRDECVGIEEHTYCQKWVNISTSEENFISTLENYRASLEKDVVTPEEDLFEFWLVDFIIEYQIYIISIGVVLFILLEIMYYKQIKKDDFEL